MSKVKESFRQNLQRCVQREKIRRVCRVRDDNDPFDIYEFVDNVAAGTSNTIGACCPTLTPVD